MNKALIEALDEEAVALLQTYLNSLVEEGVLGGSGHDRELHPSVCLKAIGQWVIASLGYPTNAVSGLEIQLRANESERRQKAKNGNGTRKPQRNYRKAIFHRDNNRCVKCGAVQDLCIDHIIQCPKAAPKRWTTSKLFAESAIPRKAPCNPQPTN